MTGAHYAGGFKRNICKQSRWPLCPLVLTSGEKRDFSLNVSPFMVNSNIPHCLNSKL